MKRTLNSLLIIAAVAVVLTACICSSSIIDAERGGLVGYWKFDGNARDSSGHGNDGVIHGAKFVEGKIGKALKFDGSDDYVEIPASPTLSLTNELTVSAWVNVLGVSGTKCEEV